MSPPSLSNVVRSERIFSLGLLHTIERDRGIERSRSERFLHELVEPFPVQSEGPDWGERPDGRCTRCVQEQGDLTEMIARSHGPYPDPVFQHLDLARADGVEGIPDLALFDDSFRGRHVGPRAML